MNGKFRAWDKENGEWFVPVYAAYEGEVSELLINMNGSVALRTMEGIEGTGERFEIVWSTGRKDKNGKEIYEGDIVHSQHNNALSIIKHGEHSDLNDSSESDVWGWYLIDVRDKNWCEPLWANIQEWGTIKGNIYSNPELTEGGEHEG